jgi:hypothetical protein
VRGVRLRYVLLRGERIRRARIRCTAANESGTCPDPLTFELSPVESAVFSGLSNELRPPDLIAEYVRTYQGERPRLTGAASRNIARLERRRGEIDREVERLVNGLAKGIGDRSTYQTSPRRFKPWRARTIRAASNPIAKGHWQRDQSWRD